MELINQYTKGIMEECKKRAKDAGLSFEDETLEYIVSNKDLIELSPKVMIPTLYDYWVFDVEVLKGKGIYELYPSNPYETVINTRPAISFYNDNNPDWLNVMIFYHVIAHIDFFQNNTYFQHTWGSDFIGRALSDKRLINQYRSQKGRWVDYIIEFSRSIDNLCGYYNTLKNSAGAFLGRKDRRLNYYFDIFLQQEKKVSIKQYMDEVDKYNKALSKNRQVGDDLFFAQVRKKYPEFENLFEKHLEEGPAPKLDLLQYLMKNSEFLNKEKNKWMKSILQIVRNTSLFFQPQIRTKIMNEGWASYWHEELFLKDERMKGHEVDFAVVNAKVTSNPRVGLNPYALGLRLFRNIEEMADRGQISFDYLNLTDALQRKGYDKKTQKGRDFIFEIRKNYNDFLFVKSFIDQDFVDENKFFVTGKRIDKEKMVWEYYIKSRKAEDYLDMVTGQLYHPPNISVDDSSAGGSWLHLVHHFEGRQLVKEFIPNTLVGLEYLWGGPVKLQTHELVAEKTPDGGKEIRSKPVVYKMENRKMAKD